MTRKFLVGGNWKLNGSKQLVDKLVTLINNAKWNEASTEVVIAPPAIYLDLVRTKLRKDVGVAAQNVHLEASGAYTGENSFQMLQDIGVQWTLLGHSERREIFKESDEFVAKKTAAAIKAGIKVIFCCGEKLEERESGKTTEVVFRQLNALKQEIQDWSHIVIAYEPVWAIGTGKVATPQQAQEVHKDIRKWLADHVSPAVAEATRILYGGSVNGGNCQKLQEEKDIDGFLVGGASLKDEFATICSCRL